MQPQAPAEYITLTDLDIERLRTLKGGWSGKAIALLGEQVMIRGWRRRLFGKRVLRANYEQARAFIALPRLKGVPRGEAVGQTSLL